MSTTRSLAHHTMPRRDPSRSVLAWTLRHRSSPAGAGCLPFRRKVRARSSGRARTRPGKIRSSFHRKETALFETEPSTPAVHTSRDAKHRSNRLMMTSRDCDAKLSAWQRLKSQTKGTKISHCHALRYATLSNVFFKSPIRVLLRVAATRFFRAKSTKPATECRVHFSRPVAPQPDSHQGVSGPRFK